MSGVVLGIQTCYILIEQSSYFTSIYINYYMYYLQLQLEILIPLGLSASKTQPGKIFTSHHPLGP